MRRVVCAAVVFACVVSLAVADTFMAVVTKVDDGKVTFHKVKRPKRGEKLERAEDQTVPLAATAKLLRGGKFDKETKKVTGGESVSKAELGKLVAEGGKGGKGRLAVIHTEKGKDGKEEITELRLFRGEGRKPPEKKSDK
jgi:hypothetical protein